MDLLDNNFTADPIPDAAATQKKGQPFDVLRTNVKGYRGDIALTPKMCLHGDNQSGKSSLIEAIRMVLTKHAPRDIGELCPDTADQLFAEIVGPSGTAKLTTERKKEGFTKPRWSHDFPDYDETEIEHMVPTVAMGGLLALGSDATREAVFRRFGNLAAGAIPEPTTLSDEQRKLWQEAVSSVKTTDPAEGLIAIRAWMNARKRKKNAEVKVLEERKKNLAAQVAVQAAGAEQLPELRARLEKAKTWENLSSVRANLAHERNNLTNYEAEAQRLLGQKQALATLSAETAERNVVLAAERDQLLESTKALQATVDDHADRLNTVSVLDKVLARMEQANVHHCPLCSRDGADAAALRASLAEKLEQRQATVEAASSQLDLARYNAQLKDAAITQLAATIRQSEGNYDRTRNDLKRNYEMTKGIVESLQASLEAAAAADYEGPDAETLRAEIEAIEGADREKANLLEIANDVERLKTDSAMSKLLEGQAKELLKGLLGSVSGAAEAGVNTYMVAPFSAVLDLEKNVWRVVGKDGKPHTKTSMCGSETGALTLALAQAWTHGSPLRILLLDDDEVSKFSPDKLKLLLASISASIEAGTITQAIIATTRPHEIPDDWTKLDMETL